MPHTWPVNTHKPSNCTFTRIWAHTHALEKAPMDPVCSLMHYHKNHHHTNRTIFFSMKKERKMCICAIFLLSRIRMHTFLLQDDSYAYVCHQKEKKKKKRRGEKKKHNKIVHCADHLFLPWLMSGRAEWQ